MEAGIMEELRICRQERELLKKKLHIHLDRWTLDRIIFEESAARDARERHVQELEHVYKTARTDLILCEHRKQISLLTIELDSAREDTILMEIQASALKSQLEEERSWLRSANLKLQDVEASFPTKVAAESKKFTLEAETKLHQLQKLLDDKQQSHGLQLQAIRDERDDENAQHENLQVKVEQLVKERDQLKNDLELSVSHRERDVEALLREKNFVWSQMKAMDAGFSERLKKMSRKALEDRKGIERLRHEKHDVQVSNDQKVAEMIILQKEVQEVQVSNTKKTVEVSILKQEIKRLRQELQDAQVLNNEKTAEITFLKCDSKRAEDQATQKRCTLEAELQELLINLEQLKQENLRLIANGVSPLDSQKEDEEQLIEPRGASETVKEGPEVLNSEQDFALDHEMPQSQVEQVTTVGKTHGITDLKTVEELRRENENLRILYSQLEVQFKEKQKQKPGKVGRNSNRRDPTSRNLKSELEAAACSSPSDTDPISERKSRKMRRPKGHAEVPGPSLKLSQTQGRPESSKQSADEGNSLDNIDTFRRRTRNSKRKFSDGKSPSQKIAGNASPEQDDGKSVQKCTSRRKTYNVDTGSTEPSLHTVSDNEKSNPKPSELLSSSNSLKQVSEKKTPHGSLTRTNEMMMSNLFSAAFSCPKLKSVS